MNRQPDRYSSRLSQTLRSTSGRWLWLVVLVLGFDLSGCSYFFGGKARPHEPVQLADQHLGCLTSVRNQMNAFIAGQSNNATAPIQCVISSLARFSEHTDGAQTGSWSLTELANFFSTYIANGAQGSAGSQTWLSPALQIKTDLMGGSDSRITKEELARLRTLLKVALPSINAMAPVMDVITLRRPVAQSASDVQLTVERTDQAVLALKALSEVLSSELAKVNPGQVAFAIDSLPPLLASVQIDTGSLPVYLPLLKAAKSFLVGGDPLLVEPPQWSNLIQAAFGIWIEAVRAKYVIADNPQILNRDLPQLGGALSDGLAILQKALEAQSPAGVIPVSKWKSLVHGLAQVGLLPFGLREKTVDGLLPIVFGKMLYGNSKADLQAKSVAFSQIQLDQIKEILSDWLGTQKPINEAMAQQDSVDATDMANALAGLPVENVADPIGARARSQMQDLLKNGRVLHMDSDLRLHIVNRKLESRVTLSDLNRLNYVRVAMAMLLRGYTHTAGAAGLTDVETQELYMDVRDLGKDLGLVDPRVTTAGTRTFMEAGIFTSVADGSPLLNLHEGVEWFHTVYGATNIASHIYADLVSECAVSDLDLFGQKKLAADCFRKRLQSKFADYLSNLPGFVMWYQAGGDARAKAVEHGLEDAARGGGYSERPIELQELRAMLPVVHYTEGVFATHDLDGNGILNEQELWTAYPIIQPFIHKVAGVDGLSDNIQKAIFSWLVVFGSPPDQGYVGSGQILAWSLAQHMWSESADRLGVLKIISSFALAVSQSKAKDVKAYLTQNQATLKQDIQSGSSVTAFKLATLFQCQNSVAPHFEQVVKDHVQDLLPQEHQVDPDQFIQKIKTLIVGDQGLDANCLLF